MDREIWRESLAVTVSELTVEDQVFGAGSEGLQPQILHAAAVLLSPLSPVKLHQALSGVQAEVVRGAGQAGVLLLGDQTGDQTGARIVLLAAEDLPVTTRNNQAVTYSSPGKSLC